ncbi:N-acetylglucosamine-6-phosphate deacetylase [Ornithinimicrobium sufpigmenti]|uniref:N-acetylglucosamine-6-phosphate deacetylase n=1 Tax=Ornithinimicrobium sufpigmenti TaxID=2508882 RepID=UPI001036CA12|nr:MULTISPECIES: amidohydrolase family protein [unclassified Ornithinimicrobium]
MVLAPVHIDGLVDIHCHGAVGHEFGRSGAGSRAAVRHHQTSGTATVVASLVSARPDELEQQVDRLLPLVRDSTIAGLHLEGPFLSSAQRGAHDPAVLADPDPDLLERLVERAAQGGAPHAIRHLTLAPELPGAERLIRRCVQLGVRPALGHTDAAADLMTRHLQLIADLQGAPALVTHLFNGMRPFHHRAGGPAAAGLRAAAAGEAVVELIADGVHLAAEVVRMVFETVGPDAVALVSDATAATGLGDGRHRLGTLEVVVEDGVARLRATGALAGSTRTLAHGVRWAVSVAGVAVADALRAAQVTGARALGLD